jgi:NAD(P)-dependent dehydrogenase (short-subunit alcohol dehydrogenase family)
MSTGNRSAGRVYTVALALSLALGLVPLPANAQGSAPPSGQRDMQDKVVLITGSTDGLGRALARTIAQRGAHVIVHGRNVERGREVVREITANGVGSARFFAADFASLDGVRSFADSIALLYTDIDLLINNAGVLVPAGQARRTSADGHELHFAVNYLAGWVLVHRLRPQLAASSPSRVINVASLAQSPIDFADVMLERPGAESRGYGQSKLAQITMTRLLAPEFAAQGITMVALHPATMMNTTMVRGSGMAARTTVEEGLDAVMALVTAPTLAPGAYFNGQQAATPHPQASNPEAQRALRELSSRLTQVP